MSSQVGIEDLVKAHIETELASGRSLKLELDTDLVGIVDLDRRPRVGGLD